MSDRENYRDEARIRHKNIALGKVATFSTPVAPPNIDAFM